MSLILKNDGMFVHVPKCAGRWIEEVLVEANLVTGRTMVTHEPLMPGEHTGFSFCFVRDPVTWYESWWKYMSGNWHPWERGRFHPQREIEDCADDDFNTFVGNVLAKHPGYVTSMYGMYTEAVDFVGKYEDLYEDMAHVMGELGHPTSAEELRRRPVVNLSERRCGGPVWDQEILGRVVEAEGLGLERYGYVETEGRTE
jgi:hypothetical protein